MSKRFFLNFIKIYNPNPAVTIAFSLVNLYPKKEILRYIALQIIGAIITSAILKVLFLENLNLGETIPAGSNCCHLCFKSSSHLY